MKKILTGISSLSIAIDNTIISDLLYHAKFEGVRQDVIQQRAKPYIYIPFDKDKDGFYTQISQLLEFGYPFLLTENGYLINGYSAINDAILTCIYGTLPINSVISEFSKLLQGDIIYGYYATGQLSEELLLNIDSSILLENKLNKVGQLLKKILSTDMENIIPSDNHDLDKDLNFLIEQITLGKGEQIEMPFIINLIKKYQEHFSTWRISDKWLNGMINAGIISEAEFLGLGEITVKKTYLNNITLLIGILASMMLDEDLYMTFDLNRNEIVICDKKNFMIKSNVGIIVLNFSLSIKSLFNEVPTKLEKYKSLFNGQLSNDYRDEDVIKNMFEELMLQIKSINPDNFIINIEGTINDLNRYTEVADIISSGNIGHKKYKGSKKVIKFGLEKELKKNEKRLKKNLP